MIFQSFCNECINECVFETHSNLLMAFQKLKSSVLNSKDLLMPYISTVVKDVFKCEEVLLLSLLYILALACAHGLRKNPKGT